MSVNARNRIASFRSYTNARSKSGDKNERKKSGDNFRFKDLYASIDADTGRVRNITLDVGGGTERLVFRAATMTSVGAVDEDSFFSTVPYHYRGLSERGNPFLPSMAISSIGMGLFDCHCRYPTSTIEINIRELSLGSDGGEGDRLSVIAFAIDFQQSCGVPAEPRSMSYSTCHASIRYNSSKPMSNLTMSIPGGIPRGCHGVVFEDPSVDDGESTCGSTVGETWIELNGTTYDPSDRAIFVEGYEAGNIRFGVSKAFLLEFGSNGSSLCRSPQGNEATICHKYLYYETDIVDDCVSYDSFQVLEGVFDPITGALAHFAADFRIQCNEMETSLQGKVRFRSLLGSNSATNNEYLAPRLVLPETYGTIDGVLRGRHNFVHLAARAMFSAHGGIQHLSVFLGAFEVHLHFEENVDPLKRGVWVEGSGQYPNPRQWNKWNRTQVAEGGGFHLFSPSHDYDPCYRYHWNFTVHELEVVESALFKREVSTLALDFHQLCDSAEEPYIPWPKEYFSWIRINSAYPRRAIPPLLNATIRPPCDRSGIPEHELLCDAGSLNKSGGAGSSEGNGTGSGLVIVFICLSLLGLIAIFRLLRCWRKTVAKKYAQASSGDCILYTDEAVELTEQAVL